jgi:hypothetical protein
LSSSTVDDLAQATPALVLPGADAHVNGAPDGRECVDGELDLAGGIARFGLGGGGSDFEGGIARFRLESRGRWKWGRAPIADGRRNDQSSG